MSGYRPVISAIPYKAERTLLEMNRAYQAGLYSHGRQEKCPWHPSDLCAQQWERGREVMRREEVKRKMPLLAHAGGR